ncbi:AEC family transporter [Prosthecomicrobium sp. N25]|uniref:AEC family transporter n=1 Tax=Prosthecomicrobium sp. N25 TaxID=3129254 RepID=UPI0030774338
MTFAETGTTVLPVFGLIAIGFAASKLGVVRDVVGEGLGEFVYVIGIPVLMFRTLATATFPPLSPWPLWISYFGGVLVAWSLSAVVAHRLYGRSRTEGVIAGVSGSFSNLVIVGTPLIVSAFGEAGAVPLFMLVSVHLPIMMVAGTLLTERAIRIDGGQQGPVDVPKVLKAIGRNLATNPLIIALVLAAAWRTGGLPLEGLPRTIVDQLGASALPAALFSLGVGLRRYGLFGELRLALPVIAIKLLLMPAVVYLVASRVFDLPPLWVSVLTVSAACPAGVNAYLFAVRFNVAHGTASNIIGLSTALAVFSVTFWLDLARP